MYISRNIAPEVDRVVWSVGRATAALGGDRVRDLAADAGLPGLEFLPPIADFLLTVGIPREVAKARLRYLPADAIDRRFTSLVSDGFLTEGPEGLRATSQLSGVLDGIVETRNRALAGCWDDHTGDVETAAAYSHRVTSAATEEHLVARLHLQIPEPHDREPLLYHRLVTLRYVRQHDHAASWAHRGFEAAEMGPLTTLWHRDPPPEGAGDAIESLRSRGLVDGDGLTDAGRSLRDEIEAETNERSDRSYAVLGDEADAFLESLRRLPPVD